MQANNSVMTMKKPNHSLSVDRDLGVDVLKTLSAFLVVVIHSKIQLDSINTSLAYGMIAFARLGVGCFFIISGYYFPILMQKGKLKGHLAKIFRLALWTMVLYIIFNMLYNQVVWHDYYIPIEKATDVTNILKFVVLNESIVDIHLWYLFAIGYTMLFCYLFYRYDKIKALYLISACLFVGGIIVGYLGYFSTQRSWLFYGIPFVAAGIFIRERGQALLSRLDVSTIVLTLSIGLLITVAEAVYLGVNRDYYILSIVLASLALLLAIKVNPLIGELNNRYVSSLCVIGVKYSMYIYIFHIAVKRTVDFIAPHIGSDLNVLHVGYPIVIFLLSLGVSMLWCRLPHRPF